MYRQAFKADTGILFHTHLLDYHGLDIGTLYPIVKPRPEAVYRVPDEFPQMPNMENVSTERYDRTKLSEEDEDVLDSESMYYLPLLPADLCVFQACLPSTISLRNLRSGGCSSTILKWKFTKTKMINRRSATL